MQQPCSGAKSIRIGRQSVDQGDPLQESWERPNTQVVSRVNRCSWEFLYLLHKMLGKYLGSLQYSNDQYCGEDCKCPQIEGRPASRRFLIPSLSSISVPVQVGGQPEWQWQKRGYENHLLLLKKQDNGLLNAIAQKEKTLHKCRKEINLATYFETGKYLIDMYTTDDAISESDTEILRRFGLQIKTLME